MPPPLHAVINRVLFCRDLKNYHLSMVAFDDLVVNLSPASTINYMSENDAKKFHTMAKHTYTFNTSFFSPDSTKKNYKKHISFIDTPVTKKKNEKY